MAKSKKPRRRARRSALPKGAYRLPTGGYVSTGPWTEYKSQRGPRRIRIVAVHRDEADVEKLARALIEIARKMRHDSEGR